MLPTGMPSRSLISAYGTVGRPAASAAARGGRPAARPAPSRSAWRSSGATRSTPDTSSVTPSSERRAPPGRRASCACVPRAAAGTRCGWWCEIQPGRAAGSRRSSRCSTRRSHTVWHDVVAVGLRQPVPSHQRTDERQEPLDDRVPRILVSLSRADATSARKGVRRIHRRPPPLRRLGTPGRSNGLASKERPASPVIRRNSTYLRDPSGPLSRQPRHHCRATEKDRTMSWTETHERYRIIREVVKAAEADKTGALPWREEYAAYVRHPRRPGRRAAPALAADLRGPARGAPLRRGDPGPAPQAAAPSHAAVLRILDRYVALTPRPAAFLTPVA